MERKTDLQIRHDVLKELLWNTRVADQKIVVTVNKGVVVLSGLVESYGQKQAAQEAAHKVAGVLDVANDLIVKAKRKYSDEQIARAVRSSLEWDVLVPDTQITSTVTDGWVKLEGKVDSLTQRTDAEWAVENLNGVIGVINEIKVEPSSSVADAETLRESIETALERRAEREAERLKIDLKNGEVWIYGKVHSWPEKKAVIGSVSHAPGVTRIVDHLTVDPYF